MFKFTATKFFVVVAPTVFVTLLAGWASAQEPVQSDRHTPGCHLFEAECSVQPLDNGRIGETVRVCRKVRLVCDAERKGTTTVQHIGR
jgi:hypothetical protein